jgi:hypothetical protein
MTWHFFLEILNIISLFWICNVLAIMYLGTKRKREKKGKKHPYNMP